MKDLFIEYAEFLNVDLCFQGFDNEMKVFPKTYEQLLLATVDSEPAAAVGLVDLGEGVCEMKRLYARPQYQGAGLGRRLCERLIKDAAESGYAIMRLDTLQRLKPAIALYKKLGFVETEQYYNNPLDEVVYMALDLKEGAS